MEGFAAPPKNLIKMENINLIRKIAWSFHNTTGIDWEELFAEASLAYCEAIHDIKEKDTQLAEYAYNYNPLIYKYMRNRLLNYIMEEKRVMIMDEDELPESSYEQTPWWEVAEQLSDTAKEIADMILDEPTEYISQPPKFARGKLRDELRKKGWSWPKIWDTFRELKLAFN